jgi:Type I phosphodiesterase / nucleotide pyrophosphatase
MTARLLIIGLDGADGRTLDRASRDGTLPNLAALRASGRAWELSSAPGATDDALWASFQYGADVSEHGRYHYMIPTSSGKLSFAITEESDRDTFWDKFSHHGLRVAVLDVPKCRPPRPLNGIHLADWLVHGRYFHSHPLAYPEPLADEILARFGPAPPSLCAYELPALSDHDVLAVRDNLLRSVAQKHAAGSHFLSAEHWDLFIIGFKEAHCSCHMFWEFADPNHAKHNAERADRLGNPVLDVLKAQDAAIGDLVAAAGPGADIIVFSTTNFAPNGSVLHLLPGILERINAYIGTSAGEKTLRVLRRLCGRAPPPPSCWAVPYGDNTGALRVRRGRGDHARRYAQRLDLITALARELVDVDDGLPVVSAVTRPASEHSGARAGSLPHLLLHFRHNICSSAVRSARLGYIEAPRPDNIRPGNHVAGGFACALGPSAELTMTQVKTIKDFASLAAKVLCVREKISRTATSVWPASNRGLK